MRDGAQRSRWRRVALLFSIVVLVATAGVAGPVRTTPVRASGDVLFGANPGLDPSGSRLIPLNELEADLGRPLDIVRVFERWDSSFGGGFHQAVESGDRIMLLSVKAKRENGNVVPWANIANAAPGSTLDDEMQTWIDRVEAFDGQVWFTFHHEPESSASDDNGNADEFVAAWRRFVDEFRARNVDNVEFAWVMTYWSFATDPGDERHADHWYPGNGYVDYIASDAYNWDNCRGGTYDPWASLEDIIEPQREFGLAHPGKGLVLAEWGSAEITGDEGAAKSRWITDAAALFKKPGWEQFVALTYFNILDDSYPACDWPLDSSEMAKAAFVAMGADPYYGGSGSYKCDGRLATLVGTNGPDDLPGTPKADVIVARGGSDVLAGSSGADAICGMGGNDTIDGGSGADALWGGDGGDTIWGRDGPDLILGGAGNDDLAGNAGVDTILGGAGDDVIRGHRGGDDLRGHGGADWLEGGKHADSILGGTGPDSILAGNGDDTVFAKRGADTIRGGYGEDTLHGQRGGDTLFGGPDDDELDGGMGIDDCTGGPGVDVMTSC